MKLLLNDQHSCVIKGGLTALYFNLEKRACHGDPILAHLFVRALAVLFVLFELIKNNAEIKTKNNI